MCPIKSGRACGKGKKSGEVVRERKNIGRRAGKEGDREARGKGKKSRGHAGKEGDREGSDDAGCVWQFHNLPHGCHIHILKK